MHIKIFESRETARSYSIVFPVMNAHVIAPFIDNEEKERITISESEFYSVIDRFFREKQNEREALGGNG